MANERVREPAIAKRHDGVRAERSHALAKPMRADELFFPAAAAFGMISVPLWLAALAGSITPWLPQRHAHELLLGYGLLVIAGYLLGRTRRAVLVYLLCTWLAARVAPWWGSSDTVLAAAIALAFSLGVAVLAAWPFLRAAKKASNRVFGPLFLAFFLCDAAYQGGVVRHDLALQSAALSVTVDAYALLLAMMGGRVLPASIAGHYYRRGRVLEDRVQPALEKALVISMIAMIAFELFAETRPLAGLCACLAAGVTAARAWRWRLWTVVDEPQLWSLGLGYLWLVPGLVLKGHALWSGGAASGYAEHALTVGAFGTMTVVMMARTRLQRSKRPLSPFADIAAAAVLLSFAALARLATAVLPDHALLALGTSAFAWTAAFGLLLRRLLLARPLARQDPGLS